MNQVQHSKENALNKRQFELLYEGCEEIKDNDFKLESKFSVIASAKLGLRAGEIIHMKQEWIDWRNSRIHIPRQEDCYKGSKRKICGYCHQLAKQMNEYWNKSDNEISKTRVKEVNRYLDSTIEESNDMTLKKATDLRWFAKTDSANRFVPFDFDPRAEIYLERFFDRYDEFPWSKSGLDRRINKALAHAEELNKNTTNPHGLRATAATQFSAKKMDTQSFQSVMGWADLQTANHYLRNSPERIQQELNYISR